MIDCHLYRSNKPRQTCHWPESGPDNNDKEKTAGKASSMSKIKQKMLPL